MIAPRSNRGLSLRVSVTNRCQLQCRYCMPTNGASPRTRAKPLSYEEIAAMAAFLKEQYGLQKVRITGGEPLVRADIESLVDMFSNMDISDIALTTNGQALSRKIDALLHAGLHRINISLDSLNPETFTYMTRGGNLQHTLDGIHAAINKGLTPVKLNMVVMRGINDHEVSNMLKFALREGCKVRFLELMPAGMTHRTFKKHYLPCSEIHTLLSREFDITPLPRTPGKTSHIHAVESPSHGRGYFGFITPISAPFCLGCQRLRLSADGHLVGCLARQNQLFVRSFLSSRSPEAKQALSEAVDAAMGHKRSDYLFEAQPSMACIGG